jgi:multidrug efflux pump subunit AcrA (membrane-fusion protein)
MRPSVLLVLGAILGCDYTQPVTGQPRVRDLDASDQQTAAEQAKSARLRATHAAKVDETKLVVAPTEADIEQFRAQQKAQAAEAIANFDAEIAQLQAKLEKAKKANERKRLESQLAELNTQLTAAKVQAPNKLPTSCQRNSKPASWENLERKGALSKWCKLSTHGICW